MGALSHGTDIRTAQELLGDKSLETMQIYTHALGKASPESAAHWVNWLVTYFRYATAPTSHHPGAAVHAYPVTAWAILSGLCFITLTERRAKGNLTEA